ncbi:O-antigen ligase family protein [Vibrio salilacus]|uniref:O-antigen ligase family protein n=1 Tax=Vibrio salilacus TaxID=1323749 RepID=UPI000C2A86AE|nr:O-antigen ligase family protein [Vibrio salilacus]
MKDNLQKALILLPFFYLFTFIAILPDGEKKMVVGALIAIAASLLLGRTDTIKNNLSNYVLWVVILFTGFVLFKYLFQTASPSMLRATLAVSLLMICFPVKLLSQRVLMWLTFIGAAVVALNSGYYFFIEGKARYTGQMNAIPYATICGALAVVGLYQFLTTKKLIPIVTTLLAVTSVLLSQTRGIWLALVCAFAILLFFYLRTQKQRWRILGAIVIALFTLTFAFKDTLIKRYEQTQVEFTAVQKGNYGTSIGLRLTMWQAATEIGKRHFWVGAGSDHKQVFLDLVEEGKIEEHLAKFHPDQYHNQFFENFAKMGIIGLLLTLLLFLAPAYYAISRPSEKSSLILALSAFYFVACLTDSPLWYAETTLMYLMLIIPLCSDQLSFKKKSEEASL